MNSELKFEIFPDVKNIVHYINVVNRRWPRKSHHNKCGRPRLSLVGHQSEGHITNGFPIRHIRRIRKGHDDICHAPPPSLLACVWRFRILQPRVMDRTLKKPQIFSSACRVPNVLIHVTRASHYNKHRYTIELHDCFTLRPRS